MTYKTILLHLHDTRRQQPLLDAALKLTRANDAHLIGMTVLPPLVVVPGDIGGPAIMVDAHRKAYQAEVEKLRLAFNTATERDGCSAEWVEADADVSSVATQVVEHARSADLVIVSQADPAWGYSDQVEAPERVVLESGRPVLIIPNSAGAGANFGRRVVVAWNGQRESTRAVFDALPLLKTAEEVIVVWVNPQDHRSAGDLPGFDVCTALSRHGVRCEATQNIRPSSDTGATILESVKNNAADLLVMGCYGHSRLTEFIFGGATRYMLEHATVPVLMAH